MRVVFCGLPFAMVKPPTENFYPHFIYGAGRSIWVINIGLLTRSVNAHCIPCPRFISATRSLSSRVSLRTVEGRLSIDHEKDGGNMTWF